MASTKKQEAARSKRRTLMDKSVAFPVTEAYKNLRTNISFALSTKKNKIFAVSSALASEGKSTVAANIAITLAQNNSKVLLNASFADVMNRLAFRPLRTGDEPLFVVQSPFGPLAAVPAESGEETAVDLEMLFNATLQNPEAINNLFTAKN